MPSTTADRKRQPAQQRGLCNVSEAAELLGCKPVSLRDRRYRARLGLAAIRIGNRLKFAPGDIEAAIARRRETLPVMPSGDEEESDV